MSGARSGALLAAASAASIVANYAFLLAAGRLLGSDDYGALAALFGLLAVVLLPAGAIQMAVSREISRLIAAGDPDNADSFARGALRLALIATLPLLGIALALAVPLARLLNIDSTGVVALTELTLATALVFPTTMGVLQGRQRFHALAALYVFPVVLRLALLAVVASAGFRLGGVVFVTLAAAIVSTLLTVALIREPLSRASRLARPDLRPFLRYLAPVAVGLVGTALLTHFDILVVKARFSGDDAGAYGAASAFARVAFFVPATILAVLFPRTAARYARGEETEDILGRSLFATAGFCGALALFYTATGVGLVTASFGTDFTEGGRVLAPFALAMGLFSLAQILVGYHLSRGETRYAWMVAAGVIVQIAVLASVPTTLRGVVWANVAIGGALLVAHELFVESSLPALRAGARHVRRQALRARAVAPETALVLLGTTAFVCALFSPLVVHLGSTIIGIRGSDSTGTVTWLWGLEHETGYHMLGTMHHTLSGAPFGWNEVNGVNLQWLLPYYPAYLATYVVGPVAALNLTTLAGYVLSGAAMYLVVRYLGCGRGVSAWAALVYVAFPWHLARGEHASLVHLEVLALLMLALLAAFRRPSWLRFAFVAAANLACWLTSGYFGGMALVTTVAFAVGAALASERRRRTLLVLLAGAVAVGAAATVALAALVSGTNRSAGIARAPGDLSVYGLRPVELFVPARGSLFFGHLFDGFWDRHGHGSNQLEVVNYLGLLTWTLAIAWVVIALLERRRLGSFRLTATAGLVTAFVAGLAFAAPSPILLFGHEVWTPSRLMWEVTPAFRVPSRWGPLLMTALLPLAALALQAGVGALSRLRRGQLLAAAAVGAALVVSFVELARDPVKYRSRTVPVPQEYVALDRTPRGILAEYPLGYSDIYRLWQRRHGRPLVNGAPPGTTADEARLVLLEPSQPGTAQNLALLGVTAIGIHPGAHVDSEVLPRDPAHDSGYRLVGRFPDGASIWKVVASPAPAFVTLPGGFGLPRLEPNGLVAYPLTAGGGVAVFNVRAKSAGVLRLVFEARPPSGERSLRVADDHAEQAFTLRGWTTVSVLVAVPRGVSQLLVKTDPPATSEADAVLISTPRTEPVSGEPALHAQLVSPDPGF